MFTPTLASGLAHIQGDWGDARLNNYILEHGYRWLVGAPGHWSLWSPPVFYPAPNTAAYSDILLGVAPFYWPWRLIGVAPDTAFQLWIMTIASINYFVAVVCCKRLLHVGWTSAALGGFVFAYGSTRVAQLIHAQLTEQFYALFVCYALVRIFEEPPDAGAGPGRRAPAVVDRAHWRERRRPAVGGLLHGVVPGFALAIGLAWSVAVPAARRRLWAVLRQSQRAIG